MNDEIFVFGFLGAIGVSALTLIVTIWIPSGKREPGWLMATSTVLMVAALPFLAMLIFGNPFENYSSRMEDFFAMLGFGALIIAAIMFTTGFVWDRVRRNREDQ